MNPIQEAIADIESRESGDNFSYREVAKKFNLDRKTLSRWHQGKQTTNAASGEAQRHLNPQQEQELVRYIARCTRRGLPPRREMLQNFASAIAK
jgi:transposase